jgi:hypothetical protein
MSTVELPVPMSCSALLQNNTLLRCVLSDSCPYASFFSHVFRGIVSFASDRSLPVILPCSEEEETNTAKARTCNEPVDWSSL